MSGWIPRPSIRSPALVTSSRRWPDWSRKTTSLPDRTADRRVYRHDRAARGNHSMRTEQPLQLDEPTQRAIAELKDTISQRYPGASFEVSRAVDDPAIVHLGTTVDVDDPDK